MAMADIISLADVSKARRQALERETTERCVEIIELNLALALQRFSQGPDAERGVRARQIRQLGEVLEFISCD